MSSTAWSISGYALMPLDRMTGWPVPAISFNIAVLVISPDATFQPATPTVFNKSTASNENGELKNNTPASSA